MIKREFTAVYQKRGDHYIAWVEEIPGTNTQGSTKREIRENLKEAVFLILDANRKLALRLRDGSDRVFREPLCVGIPAQQL